MPVSAKHQISAIATFIRDHLLLWAQDKAGTCVIVHSLTELWEQAAQSSQKPILYVCYAGETPWGEYNTRALTGRVKRNWIVVLKFGRGLTVNRGDTLNKGSQNAAPFYDWVDEVRDQIRSMLGISEDYGIDFNGIEPMKLAGQLLDAYQISFSTQNDLPKITLTENE